MNQHALSLGSLTLSHVLLLQGFANMMLHIQVILDKLKRWQGVMNANGLGQLQVHTGHNQLKGPPLAAREIGYHEHICALNATEQGTSS